MITSKYNWKNIEKEPDDGFFEVTKKENITALASKILYSRGVDNDEKLAQFLSNDLSQLHDPYLLHDMDKAVARIRQAIENYEQILVYGDYDADGMTSASIMKEALEMLGAEVQVYLPNRFVDGYGPNESVYKYFIEQQQVSLIITVDNGVAGHEAISYAQSQGVDVIVTDHHGLPAELPDAFAIVHPEYPEANYPFRYLAGCGVAFKVACALLESIPTEMLDLVAIGTIADMVSLTDENRIMVKVGLEMLKQTERIGLMELMKVSDIDMSDVNEETVGFKIAPQLNALGRLDDPNRAIELLTGFDDEEALSIAQMINAKNEERKEIVQKIYDEAMGMVDLDKPVQVLAKEGWHPGVLGIVAGRILEHIAQPVIVLNIEDGMAKGSAEVLDLSEIDLDTVKSLEKIAPFGMDNAKPVFEIKDLTVKQARTMGQNGTHLKLKIAQGSTAVDLVAFNQGHLVQEFQQAQNLCLAVTLSINKWNGQTTVQLMLEDARVDGVQLIDIRSKNASLPERVPVLSEDTSASEVVVLDIPDKAEELKSLFVGRQFDAVYFKNHIKRAYYLTGYGTREQFAKLYKTIYQFPEFDVRYKLKELSHYLNIPDILLVKMIQIFDELDFVTITDGVMVVNKGAEKRSISDSKIYQNLKQEVKFQELMALGTPQEIYDWLMN